MNDTADIGDVALHARNVMFDFSDSPLQWIPDEPVASHALSALNFMLPAGELFFVDVFGRALPHIKDEKLREAVLGFIGQEQLHSDTQGSGASCGPGSARNPSGTPRRRLPIWPSLRPPKPRPRHDAGSSGGGPDGPPPSRLGHEGS